MGIRRHLPCAAPLRLDAVFGSDWCLLPVLVLLLPLPAVMVVIVVQDTPPLSTGAAIFVSSTSHYENWMIF